ncbi:MAG: hypothetical protein LBV44_08590 [Methylobacillus sp.]|jgi:hypothetical protein|nr:hypothetical protein [Methylobacillus sp.]
MSILTKLRERQKTEFATATVATFATDSGDISGSVATVASVAVANSEDDDAFYWWEIHFSDRAPVTVSIGGGHSAEIAMSWYPNAIAAVPINSPIPTHKPTCSLSADEEKAIRSSAGKS